MENVLVQAAFQNIQIRQEQSQIPDDRPPKQEPQAPRLFLPSL
jgi:hypothetical protein